MQQEREHIDLLDFTITDGKVEYPNFPYNGIELGMRQAVGLVIFRINQARETEILLGKHRSPRNLQKHGKWGWFGETREEDDLGTLNTLYRLTAEEFERNLADFRLFSGQTNELNYEVRFEEGKRSYVADLLVAYTDEDLTGHISDFGEIEEVRFFSLESVLTGRVQEPLRGSVIPALQQLYDQAAFETPVMPLRRIVMPKAL